MSRLLFRTTLHPAKRWVQAGWNRGLKTRSLQGRVKSTMFNHAKTGSFPPVEIHDPANGVLLGAVPDMGVDGAKTATDEAFMVWDTWRSIPPLERGNLLQKWHSLIMEHADDLAVIITSESGKPLAEGKGEVLYAASFVDFFAGETRRLEGCVLPPLSSSKRMLATKHPVGPAALITPWNFPAAMITRKAAAALAAGCPVVIKPAEATPFTAVALQHLAVQAGIPPAAIGVVTSSRASVPAIGDFLAADTRLRKLSFTGSTAVGKRLLQQSAATVKRVSMELGGNAPFIVMSDADLDAAADGLIASKFRNAGQTCVSANRVLVASEVLRPFTDKLCDRVAKLKVGHGLDEGVTVGPLIDADAVRKVAAQVEDAKAKGAIVVTGGNSIENRFFEPTVLSDVDPSMLCCSQETFGPLVPLIPFSSPAEALALANDSSAGLAAYLYSRDLGLAWRVAEGLEYGMVGVNEGVISSALGPFGGMKESGLGREGSKFGLDECDLPSAQLVLLLNLRVASQACGRGRYLEVKYICLGLGPTADGLPNMP